MKRSRSILLALACAALADLPGALLAQQAASNEGQKKPAQIFCNAKKAGQLCNHGTADVLKLSGAKRERWTQLVNRYNQRVEEASKELLSEAKSLLSAEEYAQVETWLDRARNAELNRLLAEN